MERVEYLFSGISGRMGEYEYFDYKGKTYRRKIKHRKIINGNSEARKSNIQEFGNLMSEVKMFKEVFADIIENVKDKWRHQRLTSLCAKIRNTDFINPKGSRSIAKGLFTEKGKSHLKCFNFKHNQSIENLIQQVYKLDLQKGNFEIKSFVAKHCIPHNKNYNKISISIHQVNIDFEDNSSTHNSSEEIELWAVRDEPKDLIIQLPFIPLDRGVNIYVLRICYYKAEGGEPFFIKYQTQAEIIEVI